MEHLYRVKMDGLRRGKGGGGCTKITRIGQCIRQHDYMPGHTQFTSNLPKRDMPHSYLLIFNNAQSYPQFKWPLPI